MTAPTARHALELAVKFAPTRTNALRLSLEVHDQAFLYMDELLDLGAARDTVLVALAVGIWRIGETLTGAQLGGRADFAFPEPSYLGEQHGPLSVRFNQPRNCLVFDRAYLDLPLTTAHASASQLAQEQCERALAELNQPQLINRVREAMLTARGEFQDLAGVAKTLGVSERTLKRKLQAEGAAFSEISDNVRCEHASALLRDPKLSIDEVAERTGYADTSNFSRAFRRWTGKTPAAFRKG
jgi:AraC-like DNA-binding protein